MSDTVMNVVVSELPKITWEKHSIPNLSSLVFQASVLKISPLIHADFNTCVLIQPGIQNIKKKILI